MAKHQYCEICRASLDALNAARSSGDTDALKNLVLAFALHGEDHQEAVGVCEELSCHACEEVRGNALLGLGHLARRFGILPDHIKAALTKGLSDESAYVRGQAAAAIDDAGYFLGWDCRAGVKRDDRQ